MTYGKNKVWFNLKNLMKIQKSKFSSRNSWNLLFEFPEFRQQVFAQQQLRH